MRRTDHHPCQAGTAGSGSDCPVVGSACLGSLIFLRLGALLSLLWAWAGVAQPQVSLTWDANSEPDLAGYRLYWGTASRTYTQTNEVVNVTTTTVSNLTEEVTYYFAVTAYKNSSLESDFSDEVSFTPPKANSPPVADGQSVSTLEDTPLAVVLSGSDVEGAPLTFVVMSQPAHGSLSGTAPNLVYHPATNYAGADSFTFQVSDGQTNSLVAQVWIAVIGVNDPPVAVNPTLTTLEDTPLDIVLGGSDVEGDPLTFVVMSQPAHGTLSGTAPNLVYHPATSYAGADSFTFQVSDGRLQSDPATATISVEASTTPGPEDAPTIRGTSPGEGSGFLLSWGSKAGYVYRVVYKDDFSSPTWTAAGGDIRADGPEATWTDTDPNALSSRFYAVQVVSR